MKTNKLKIEKTITRLFRNIDDRNWKDIEPVLNDNLSIDYSSWTCNPPLKFTKEELLTEWISINGSFDRTHHMLGNFEITIDGISADAFLYTTAKHNLVHADGDVWSVYGTYDIHFELEGREWIIDSIRFNFMFEDGNTQLFEKTEGFAALTLS